MWHRQVTVNYSKCCPVLELFRGAVFYTDLISGVRTVKRTVPSVTTASGFATGLCRVAEMENTDTNATAMFIIRLIIIFG